MMAERRSVLVSEESWAEVPVPSVLRLVIMVSSMPL